MKVKLSVSDVPYMLAQWDHNKNTASPDEVSAKCKTKKYFWKCLKCGYEWKGYPKGRYDAKGSCSCCDTNKVIVTGINDVLTLVPELRKWYDAEKNAYECIDISTEGVASETKVWWKCNECGRSWKTSILSRVRKNPDGVYEVVPCPHYNTSKRNENKVPMVSEIPELMKFWDFNKNKISPSQVKSNSNDPVFWKCVNCGYNWETSPRSQLRGTGKCLCCELYRVTRKGYTDLFTLLPEALEYYDFERNAQEGIDPYSLSAKDSREVWWHCKNCGRRWKSAVMDRVDGASGSYRLRRCQNCYFMDSKRIVPISSKPELMKFWKAHLNGCISCDEISAHSVEPVWFQCDECGYKWQASPKSRISNDRCPCCDSGRVATGINDILTLLPEIANIYDFQRNEADGINIFSLGINSTTQVHWHCNKCGRNWMSPVNKRIQKDKNGYLRVVPCSECSSGVFRKQKWSEQYPELAQMYNRNLNPCDLDEIPTSTSNTTLYWWTCPVCGQDFPSRIYSMIQSLQTSTKGCPYCSRTKLADGESFADIHPELLAEYSRRNTIDPKTVFPNDKTDVEWVCQNDPSHVWMASFALRHAGGGKCPVCTHSYVVSEHNSFAAVYPELLHMWSPKNERSPWETFYDSSLWLYWICPDCGGEYGAYIRDVIDDTNVSCPYCADRMVLPGFNSLQALYPDIAKFYSPDNEISPDNILPTWTRTVLWICPECGGTFSARVCDFVNGEYDCPYCTDRKVLPGFNSLQALYPDIAKFYSPDNELSPDNFLPTWTRTVLWICPECSGTFYARVCDFVNGEHDCPYCTDRKVLPGFNSLQALYPDIAKFYSPNNELSPDNILPSWTRTALWICPECSGTFYARVCDFVNGEHDCPYCTDRKVLPGFNSLQALYPDIAKFYSPDNEISPDNILPSWTRTVLWICPECSGTISARICDFVNGEYDCPYCTDRKVLPGFNSFKVRHPDLMGEWNYLNNYLLADPDKISDGNQTPVWWNCSNNPKHHYRMSVADRLMYQHRERESCPYCKGRRIKLRHFV